MNEALDIINCLKKKYPNEDLDKIINYYENILKDGSSLDAEQVIAFYNMLDILSSNPNKNLLSDFVDMEYKRFCNKYGEDVIEDYINRGGRK